MKLTQLNIVLLCIFSWSMGFLTYYLQQDEIAIEQAMTIEKALSVVGAHNSCIQNLETGFCFMTFENYIEYYDAMTVIEKDN